jgi:hypothetical protein
MAKKKPTAFNPITPTIATGLIRIEAIRQAIQILPITPLTQEQVAQVTGGDQHFPDGSGTRTQVVCVKG